MKFLQWKLIIKVKNKSNILYIKVKNKANRYIYLWITG